MGERIEFDYYATMRVADKLDKLAERIDKLKNGKLLTANESVFRAWKGESASLYMKKITTLESGIGKSSTDIRKAATEVRKVAEALYQAEQKNIQIAQSSGGGGSS